ncbi:hypothetical protein ACFE04_026474 [Oxalis oulophora]
MAELGEPSQSLLALLVFQNTINKEVMRSLHVYQYQYQYQLKEENKNKNKNDKDEDEDEDEDEDDIIIRRRRRSIHDFQTNTNNKLVERQFLFNNYDDDDHHSSSSSYVEMETNPPFLAFALQDLLLVNLHHHHLIPGHQLFGCWLCILDFHAASFTPYPIPPILSISRNPKLKSIASLANDLQTVYQFNSRTEDKLSRFSSQGVHIDYSHRVKNTLPDLNCLPELLPITELTDHQQLDQPGMTDAKKKRAAAEDIAKISLDDLIKYFDVPITEASRNLNVGLTVLKKRCRELGIPRWPHRKIKSLDSLINNLQEEVARRQKLEDTAAVRAVANRQSMLQKERESIERKPFMELQSETKKFRQDMFKRRHRARVLKNQDMTQLTIS